MRQGGGESQEWCVKEQMLPWAAGARSQGRPSDAWHGPQNCPAEGPEDGYLSISSHPWWVEACSWHINAPGIPVCPTQGKGQSLVKECSYKGRPRSLGPGHQGGRWQRSLPRPSVF